jgi:manganese oxidase
LLFLLPFLIAAQSQGPDARAQRATSPPLLDSVVANDNRVAGGAIRGGVYELRLDARLAAWRPDLGVDTLVTVQVFAEERGAPRIPGPLLRVMEGTEVRISVRNSLPDSSLLVHGLRAGAVAADTLRVASGSTREVRFRAGAPGTYLYWGTTTGSPIHDRPWRDAQLTGAIVVDARGTRPDPAERIFLMTVLDVYPDDTVRNRAKEDIWELAINGRSWPHSERLEYAVGDTVRWRWINGSYLPHPMHLHGFHFRVLAKGKGSSDSTYTASEARLAATELMLSGSTFRMEWVPTRPGTWLMHCHMIPHITPFPPRPDSTRGHDAHDPSAHPLVAMSGLVLGITTVDRRGLTTPVPAPSRRLRLFAQQAPSDSGKEAPRGYVLQRGAEPRADSIDVPGAPLVLTRGETTAITVVNRMREPTTVHWHGMELESVYDGVAGWSRTRSSVAPMIAPGDSFTVAFTPPRAGTFIYHTHIDEGPQLSVGMYGPLIVVEPGDRYDPETDLVFMIGGAMERGKDVTALNGRSEPPPRLLKAHTRYRLRFVNIHAADVALVELRADSVLLAWQPIAKDGADLNPAVVADVPARVRWIGAGETYDYVWTPDRAMDAVLTVSLGRHRLRQSVIVR